MDVMEGILVVDDEESIRTFCERALGKLGFQVKTAADGASALAMLALGHKDVDFILTDITMPGDVDGVRLVEEVRHLYPEIDVAIMTAYPTLGTAVPVLKKGACDYLIKPFPQEVLKTLVNNTFQKRRLSRELNRERLLRQELEAAYKELQKVEALKEAFLSRLNHELRTPLGPALMALQAVEPELKSPLAVKFGAAIKDNLQKLQGVVENLLAFSEIKKDDFAFTRSDVRLWEIVKASFEKYRSQWESRDIRVEMDFQGEDAVFVSPDLMATVFKHLLLNAVQFTPKGGSIRAVGRRESGQIKVLISDSGIGIPADQQGKIFDGFYQVADFMTRKVGGLGLGLAIVRRILESHDGAVTVESEEGKGAVFHVILPIEKNHSKTTAVASGEKKNSASRA